jgi:hypothetical protein
MFKKLGVVLLLIMCLIGFSCSSVNAVEVVNMSTYDSHIINLHDYDYIRLIFEPGSHPEYYSRFIGAVYPDGTRSCCHQLTYLIQGDTVVLLPVEKQIMTAVWGFKTNSGLATPVYINIV